MGSTRLPASANAATRRVLIPSSSGHGFNPGATTPFGLIDVLIPSSSGHGFNLATTPSIWPPPGLNPFFIRAWVQPGRAGIPPLWGGLNPFFIRAWVQPRRAGGHGLGGLVLIPSSSGHGFNHPDGKPKEGENPRLNPFFIRAWVQPCVGRETCPSDVLIPSSSGHGFNPRSKP